MLCLIAWFVSLQPVQGEMLFSRPYKERLTSMDVASTGLVALGANKLVYIYDPVKKVDLTLEAHAGFVSAVVFSSDGSLLVTASQDRDTKVWRTNDWKMLREMTYSRGRACNAAVFSPDGRTIATGNANGDIVLWDVKTGKELQSFSHDGKAVSALAYSPKGEIISGGDTSIIVWDAATGKRKHAFPNQKGYPRSLVVLKGSRTLLSGSREDDNFRVWDLEKGKATTLSIRIPEYGGPLLSLSPSGKLLVIGGDQNIGYLVDVAAGKYMNQFEVEGAGGFNALRFSPGEDVVYTVTPQHLLAWKVKK